LRGNSDTEALLHLYEERGDAMLEQLRGMFAFALYDRKRRRLLIARDRLGKKPLYYHDDGKRLAFASELKALMLDPRVKRDVDPVALADYLTFQYVPSPGTILAGVQKLPPAHFKAVRRVRVERHWSLPVRPDSGHDAHARPRAAGGSRALAALVGRSARSVSFRRNRL
jgi:asparagine synthase (glutamine-hydrolysing)